MKTRPFIVVVFLVNVVLITLSFAGGTTVSAQGPGHLPIVFVTGWNGTFPDYSCGQSNPELNWPQEIADLRSNGYDNNLFFAILNSSWCYTPPLALNATILRNKINEAKSATGQSKVILIAHSMGGVVSRAYIEGDSYQNDVDTLFTLGSPHLGVPDQAFLLFAFYGAIDQGTYFSRQPVALELTQPGMWVFNLFHSKRDGVNYHFISGDAPDSSRYIPGFVTNLFIPPPNDVAIPTNSGRGDGLSGIIDRMTTDEVHSSQVGPRDYFVRDRGLSRNYNLCLKPILVNQTNTICGGPMHPVVRSAVTDVQSSISPMYLGTILNGQIVTTTFSIESGPALFATSWQTGTVSVSLVDPNGQTIDPAFAAANPGIVTYAVTGTLATYNFPNAISGTWSAVLQGTSVPTGGTAVSTFASVNSGITLAGQTDRLWYTPGATAVITATVSGSFASANVQATITRPDAITQTVNLSPAGAGQYQGTYIVPNVPGYAQVYLTAQGTTTGGATFQKATGVLFQIASNRSSLNGTYGDVPEPRAPGSSLYKALRVNVGINSSASGTTGLAADLFDLAGNLVAHTNTLSDAPAGSGTLTLRFDGADIYAAGRNGPYRLTNLLLTDEQSVTLVMLQAANVYTTAAYNYQSFASPAVYLPFIKK